MEIRNHVYHFSLEAKLTGKRIKELRKERKMTAQNLADALLCSVKTVSSWETGARFPSIDNLVDLSNFFDVSVHSLMLPLDNCPVTPTDIRPNESINPSLPSYDTRCDSDEDIASLLIRIEYLLQRQIANVATKENWCEFNETSFGLRLRIRMPAFNFKMENTTDAFWKIKRAWFDYGELYYIIFNRILHGDNLNQTLEALDLFERSVFLTMLCYFPELRAWDCVKALYESGASFIDCGFVDRLDEIKKGAADKEKGYLFDVAYRTYEEVFRNPSEEVEELFKSYYDIKRIPRYSEAPSLYDGDVKFVIPYEGELVEDPRSWFYIDVTELLKYSETPSLYKDKKLRVMGENCKDPNERQRLAKYYYFFDFVVSSIESLEDFENRMITSNECFDIYMEELVKRGVIQE
jgi:transcriptional regulator with XRE-family HTH domain